jgi:phosphatidylinositol glycan class O
MLCWVVLSERLVSQAGPGGAYADALLLVLSDHGQTQGGDHGGGTPDETDSILVAMSLTRMNATLQQQQQQSQQQQPQQPEQQQEQQLQQQEEEGPQGSRPVQDVGSSDSELLLKLMAAAGCVDGPASTQHNAAAAAGAAAAGAGAHAAAAAAAKDLQRSLVCGNTVPQIDLTPLLSHLLGVPAPFANLGKLPPHLFATLATAAASGAQDASTAAWLPGYAAALAANAGQVHGYLNRYAQVGRLPAAQLAAVNELYAALQQQHQVVWQEEEQQQEGQHGGSGGSPSSSEATHQLEGLVTAQLRYLAAAADLARRRFTLFQQGPIWAGCGLAMLVLLGQLGYLRYAALGRRGGKGPQHLQAHDCCGCWVSVHPAGVVLEVADS